AQLFVQNGASLTPLVPVSTFRPVGKGAASIADRYWFSKPIEVPGVPPGQSATFVVRAWKTSFGTYEAALPLGEAGHSEPVTVTVSGGLGPPANLVGLQGFVLGVPEPSTIVL